MAKKKKQQRSKKKRKEAEAATTTAEPVAVAKEAKVAVAAVEAASASTPPKAKKDASEASAVRLVENVEKTISASEPESESESEPKSQLVANRALAPSDVEARVAAPTPPVASAMSAAAPSKEPTPVEPASPPSQETQAAERLQSKSKDEGVAVLDEHRASPRMTLEVDIHLSSDSHFFTGLSGDISEGGVFISTYRQIATGSVVDVEFSLPRVHKSVRARGTVRWQRLASPDAPPGVGIAFMELSSEDKSAIQRFCVTRPALFYDVDD